jgi:2,4-dienoyl-CoA reductase-like NADH-dependent reductase (Old Yellow Enzyme family)
MPELFEPTSIGNLVIKNRFVRSATWEGMATKGGLMKKGLLCLSADIARGGVGLIISGHAYVSHEGQATPFQLAASSDSNIRGLREMAEVVHEEKEAKCCYRSVTPAVLPLQN